MSLRFECGKAQNELHNGYYTERKICMRFNIQECEANMHYRYLNLIYIGVLNLIYIVY